MKHRLLLSLIAAGLALASTRGVASANPDYWRANGLLLEVSADPRDGRDLVQVDATPANSLELIALNDTVTLRRIVLRFTNGRTMAARPGVIQPGLPLHLRVPAVRAAIASVELDYGPAAYRSYDRTPARLQIIARPERMSRGYALGPRWDAYDSDRPYRFDERADYDDHLGHRHGGHVDVHAHDPARTPRGSRWSGSFDDRPRW